MIVLLDTHTDGHGSTDPDSPRVRAMVAEEYEELPFPDDKNFTAMRIYARRE